MPCKKLFILLVSAIFCAFALFGCTKSTPIYIDGTYRSELKEYDSRGYKDFMEIIVSNGAVTAITFDATNAEGQLRTQDAEYTDEMQPIQGTKPAQYSSDLVNQYLASKDIDEVVAVAGATISSENFKKLFVALENPMENGITDLVVVENTSL